MVQSRASSSSSKPELAVMRDRLRTHLRSVRVIHALIYFPDDNERVSEQFNERAALNDRERTPLFTSKPVFWQAHCSRRDKIFACVSGGTKTYNAGHRTVELAGFEPGNSGGEETVYDWFEIAVNLWGSLIRKDWEKFSVPASLGPSLGNTESSQEWGRLLHLAAWSQEIPGLKTEIHRFNTLGDGFRRVHIEAGSPADPVELVESPQLPDFEPSQAYASLLTCDAIAASVLLADFLLNNDRAMFESLPITHMKLAKLVGRSSKTLRSRAQEAGVAPRKKLQPYAKDELEKIASQFEKNGDDEAALRIRNWYRRSSS